MDKFDREGLRAALKSGNIPVSDDEIRQLDGVLRALAQQLSDSEDRTRARLEAAVGEIGSY